MNGMFENELFLDMLLVQERRRRINFEGPPTENLKTIIQIDGSKCNVRENGKIWDINNPCTKCNEDEALNYLVELSKSAPVIYKMVKRNLFAKIP